MSEQEPTQRPDPTARPFILGLMGAPGAGKSETAQAFKALSADWMAERGLTLTIIDNIDRIIEEDQDRAVGVFGDGYVTQMIYFLRQMLQDRAMARNECILLCGTLIENIAHVNARIKLLGQMVQTPDTGELITREVMVGQILASYIIDGRFLVNFAFYTPLPAQIIIPGQEKGTFPVEVDEFIRDLNVKMQLGMPVIEGTAEERAQQVFDNVLKNYTGDQDMRAVEEDVQLQVPE